MITLMILTIITLIVIAVSVILISIGGAAFIIIFADLLVCIFIILWIIKIITKRKFKK